MFSTVERFVALTSVSSSQLLLGLVLHTLSTQTFVSSNSGTLANTSHTENHSRQFDNEYLLSSLSLVTRDVSTSHVTVSTPDVTSDTEQLDRRLTPSTLTDIVTRENVLMKEDNNTSVNMSLRNDTYRSVLISLNYIANCLKKRSTDAFKVTDMQITINVSYFIPKGSCKIKVTLPVDHMAHVQFTRNTSCEDLHVYLFDVEEHFMFVDEAECRDSVDTFSFSNEILVSMESSTIKKMSISLDIKISAVHIQHRPQLQVIYTTHNHGYVRTPNWNESIPTSMDSWTNILIPNHHMIMVSFQKKDMIESYECEHDKLSLYSEEPLITHLILRTCDSRQPPVSLYNVSKLYIHFRSVTLYPETGFRLVFSVHALSALPQQLRDGRWNCSVPHWPDFRLHFPCNLVSDCVGNEDEVDCPYTSHVCGPGFLSANGTCLQFVKTVKDVSWVTASETCKSRGLLLMTANTPAEWEATRDLLLRYFPDSEFVLYGARQPSSSLSYMYRQVLIGADGIANYLQPVSILLKYNECLGVNIRPDDSGPRYGPIIANCRNNFLSWFACKFPVSPDDTLPQMPVLLTANWSVDVLQCPSLHYTHTFLACDVKSECWADKYDNSKTCSTPLTSRPPSFSCINEIQRVPYSLVCDHRSHCSDDSDEKFCIFPSCPRKTNVFECDNKQCIPNHFLCDEFFHCLDGSDERRCMGIYLVKPKESFPPPAIIDLDSEGLLRPVKPLTTTHQPLCNETHLQCPGIDYYCLPVYVRCNGVFDCPGKQDETACDTYTCPGCVSFFLEQ